jgi:hypothetical protein
VEFPLLKKCIQKFPNFFNKKMKKIVWKKSMLLGDIKLVKIIPSFVSTKE